MEKDSLDFNAAFSPDGQSFYFSRSRHGKYDMFVSGYRAGAWQPAVLAPFSEKDYSEADPAFAPNGDLYFISDRPVDEKDSTRDFNIWYITAAGEGQWSEPYYASAVNSDSTEYYVSFSGNGNLYFASDRPGGMGLWDIYVSEFSDGTYGAPRNLGPSINSDSSEHDPCISPDETLLLFTSVNRKDGEGAGDIYYSTRGDNQDWKLAQNIGTHINTPTYEYCSYFTPDGKYFFFSSEYNVKWIDRNHLLMDN